MAALHHAESLGSARLEANMHHTPAVQPPWKLEKSSCTKDLPHQKASESHLTMRKNKRVYMAFLEGRRASIHAASMQIST